jgi:hypothetical protein
VKILLPIDDSEGPTAEGIWAEDLGDGTYRVDNHPHFRDDVAFGDIVTAKPSGELETVVRPTSDVTLRVMFDWRVARRRRSVRVIREIVSLGGSGEWMLPGALTCVTPLHSLSMILNLLSERGAIVEPARRIDIEPIETARSGISRDDETKG